MKNKLFLSLLISACICACNTKPVNPAVEPEKSTDTTTVVDTTVVVPVDTTNNEVADGVRTPKQITFTSVDEQLLYRTNEFSFNLLSYVSQHEDKPNIILSPLSASMMLGMCMNGADDETLEQMQKVLGFEGLTEEQINEYYHNLIVNLPQLDTVTKLSIANSIWIDYRFPVKPNFIDINQQTFNAASQNVDMANSETVDIMNKWAADNTNNLIPKIVEQKDIVECVMVLANALYFKSLWDKKFDEKRTSDSQFTTFAGSKMSVKMMVLDDELKYTNLPTSKLLELDYLGGQYCMDILLPTANNDIRDIVAELTIDDWNSYLSMLHPKSVYVNLPKFQLRYDRNLTGDLKALGISRAFKPIAQFSRISTIPTYLSWVKQLCYLSVDEEGTEAAAVTVGGFETTGMPEYEPFIVDHPFLVVIREKKFGTILFTAIISQPE